MGTNMTEAMMEPISYGATSFEPNAIMVNHPMAYFISGSGYSNLNVLRTAGLIDLHYVIHGGGVTPSAQVVTDCNNAKMSPVLNNGNDGIPGWNGSNSYYVNIANQGWHAAGGESVS